MTDEIDENKIKEVLDILDGKRHPICSWCKGKMTIKTEAPTDTMWICSKCRTGRWVPNAVGRTN